MSIRHCWTLALLCTLFTGYAFAQQEPLLEKGFAPDKVFQFGDLDSVQLLNGNLVIRIPIGLSYPVGPSLSYQLALYYNSKAWDFLEIESFSQARGDRSANAGMGWRLSLGQLLATGDAIDDGVDYWAFVSPDGAEHAFRGCDEQLECISRDSSYLRLTPAFTDNSTGRAARLVQFPDGTEQRFEKFEYGQDFEWRLVAINDKFPGAGDDIAIDYSGEPDDTSWAIHDRWGRYQWVFFEKDPRHPVSNRHRRVTEVVTSTFGGGMESYRFRYSNPNGATTVQVPCGSAGMDNFGDTTTVSLLAGITVTSSLDPNDTSPPVDAAFGMTYPTSRPAGSCRAPALITKLTLPTGGWIEWDYVDRGLPTPTCTRRKGSWHSVSAAISRRTLADGQGGTVTWRYSSALSPKGYDAVGYNCPDSNNSTLQHEIHEEELRVYVRTPSDDREVHYFSVYPDPAAPGGTIHYDGPFAKDDFGLPFTRRISDGDPIAPRYLSTEFQDCDLVGGSLDCHCTTLPDGAQQCPALTRTFVRYESDPQSPCSQNTDIELCATKNRREASTRTVDFDGVGTPCTWPAQSGVPSCNSVWEDRSDYDNYGHFRTRVSQANFSTSQRKTSYTAHDPNPSAWLLELFSERRQSENGTQTVQFFDFDRNTGLLNCVRTGAGSSADSLVSYIYNPDASGFPESEGWYGGDEPTYGIGTAPTCTPSVSPKYVYTHSYQAGVRSSTTVSLGPGESLNLLDRDIDAATGLTATSRDSAGVATTFSYDWRGFLTNQSHAGLAPVTNALCLPGTTTAFGCVDATKPQVRSTIGSVSAPLQDEAWTFDGLGRLVKQQRRRPTAGSWDGMETVYDAAGRRAFVGEWGGGTSVGTTLEQFDAFGRPKKITKADGTKAELEYYGMTGTARTVDVWNGKTPVSRRGAEFYDREGRIAVVKEANGVRTRYHYDAGGHLRTVAQNVGKNNTVQVRRFHYDERGFMWQDDQPESGKTFYQYDSKGNVTRVIKPDGTRLDYSYDAAGRPTEVRSQYQVLKTFEYWPDGYGKGKLKKGSEFNFRSVGSPAACTQFEVRQEYGYTEPHGLVTSKTTTIVDAGVEKGQYTQSYSYDGAGRIISTSYPNCTGCPTTARTVAPQLSFGRPVAIPGFASSITYFANGMVDDVTHQDAHSPHLIDDYEIDGSLLPRPSAIAVRNAPTDVFPRQAYAYDASGNIQSIGDTKYAYDEISRLGWAYIPEAPDEKLRQFTYDVFGNLTQMAKGTLDKNGDPLINGDTFLFPTSQTTNRLSPPSDYSASGNLTNYNLSTYKWDSFSNLAQVNTGSETWIHTYDAQGERTWSWRTVPSAPRVDTIALRDLGGSLLRDYRKELNGTTTTTSWEDYIYREGQLLASVDSTAPSVKRHVHLDHLGTVRRVTNDQGQLVGQHDLWPYGEEYTPVTDGEQMRFTGHERDLGVVSASDDDMDYMHARHYRPLLGRFLSVDRHPGASMRPQSWNRYAYSYSNPLKYNDPDGRSPVLAAAAVVLQRAAVGAVVGAGVRLAINYGIRQTVYPNYPVTRGVAGAAAAGAITGGVAPEAVAAKMVVTASAAAAGAAINGVLEGKTPSQIESDIKAAAVIGLFGGLVDATASARIATEDLGGLAATATGATASAISETLGEGNTFLDELTGEPRAEDPQPTSDQQGSAPSTQNCKDGSPPPCAH